MRHFLVFVAAQRPHATSRRPRAGDVTPAEAPGSLQDARLGVTVTRKVGGAVKRNRIKRLVREAFRRERGIFEPGLDMVWVAKRNATETSFQAIVSDMHVLARKLSRRGSAVPPQRGTA